MIERLRAVRTNDDGFTLIELLVVIVILGVLSGVVVFAVQAFNNQGITEACKADKKNVEIADEAYFARTGGHAAGADPLQTLVDAGYLKEKPSTAKYTITLAAGAVTASC